VVVCSALAAWHWRHRPPAAAGDDPRLTFPTPYRNVRPEVAYVGDEACAGCHGWHAENYHRHPMGRSFAPASQVGSLDRYDAAAHNPFERPGRLFSVERRGEAVFHKEVVRGPQGRPLAEIEAEVHYAVGSGARGRSYLVNRDGYLFESPISWFSQKGSWDVSPGFEAEPNFERPIIVQCLFCHANDAAPVEHTLNRYRPPIFRGWAIGCERCHGPGDLHVRRRQAGEDPPGPDDTIVNPARLEPALREAVCEQCHLEGEQRVLRRGRQPFDYRPGLPLYLFWSVFVRVPELTEEHQAVGQVEQMRVSRCFTASNGKLGCISCHDPHQLPEPENKVAFYRGRCLSCHKESSCSLAAAVRRQQSPDDDCSACHMSRRATSDIAHTAITDHRIPRVPAKGGAAPAPARLLPGDNPLVSFYKGVGDPRDREVNRDMGVALIEVARQKGAGAEPLGPLALPYLEGAVHRAPDDTTAWEAKGYALWLEGRIPEALDAFESALTGDPGRERSLRDAAVVAALLKRPEAADAYWRRAIAVNPWSAFYHEQLAQVLVDRQDWQGALAECRVALQLNPTSVPARRLLIQGHLREGHNDQARAEFDVLLALQPSQAEALRRWFADQMR
jgi:Flp pilus assembly protein TadD